MNKARKPVNIKPPGNKRLVTLMVAGLLVAAAVTAAWMSLTMIEQARWDSVLARLPAIPNWSGSPEVFHDAADTLERGLRSGPLGPGIGSLGNLYLANYCYDEAAKCYEITMEFDPSSGKWPYLLAYVRSMKGETGSCADLLDKAVELAPDYSPALLRRADEHYKIRDPQAASADYRRVLGMKSSDAYAHFGLARIASDEGKWEEAKAHLDKALAADPLFGNAHRLMASVHGHFGRAAEQEKALKTAEACGRFVPPPDPWVDELESMCYHVEKLLAKAFAADKTRKLDVARTLCERVVAIAPESFDATFRLANVLQALGDRARAETLFRKALTLRAKDESRYPVIHNNLGEILFRQGRLEEAAAEFEEAVKLEPDIEAAHLNLGCVLTNLGRPAEAAEHCQRVLALNPESDGAHFNLALALLKTGKPDEAKTHYLEALRINPRLYRAHYQLGVYFQTSGNAEQAATHFQQALAGAEAAGDQAMVQILRRPVRAPGPQGPRP